MLIPVPKTRLIKSNIIIKNNNSLIKDFIRKLIVFSFRFHFLQI